MLKDGLHCQGASVHLPAFTFADTETVLRKSERETGGKRYIKNKSIPDGREGREHIVCIEACLKLFVCVCVNVEEILHSFN